MRHDKEEMLAAARTVVAADGLAHLTFRKVAERLDIADRTVVYYFPNKEALVAAVVGTIRDELQALLDQTLGDQAIAADELVRQAWPVLSTPSADRTFKVFFELLGLAAANVEPYAGQAAPFVGTWVAWTAERVTGPSPEARHRAALGVVARLDGLLLMRQVLGAPASDEAATELGLA